MDIIGIIGEYNPFHNGHLHHLQAIKKMHPKSLLVLVLSGPFTQRGEISILNKWEKTEIALNHGIDLVIELPFKFASQSADIFAQGAITILNKLDCDYLIFGSETNDIDKLTKLAKLQIEDVNYNLLVKDYLDEGLSYPAAMSKAFAEAIDITINEANDILGLAYVKEILKQKAKIIPQTIQRTNDYHNEQLNNKIVSATAIRKAFREGKNIKAYLPKDSWKFIKDKQRIDIFKYFKYKVLSEKDLAKYQTVDEGIDNRIKAVILDSDNLEDFIQKLKTKRYTYNRINRMIIHILTSFTKEEAKDQTLRYIRVLGFNKHGLKHLNKLKKKIDIHLISNMKKSYDKVLKLDVRVEQIYQHLNQQSLDSYKNPPIKKDL